MKVEQIRKFNQRSDFPACIFNFFFFFFLLSTSASSQPSRHLQWDRGDADPLEEQFSTGGQNPPGPGYFSDLKRSKTQKPGSASDSVGKREQVQVRWCLRNKVTNRRRSAPTDSTMWRSSFNVNEERQIEWELFKINKQATAKCRVKLSLKQGLD